MKESHWDIYDKLVYGVIVVAFVEWIIYGFLMLARAL